MLQTANFQFDTPHNVARRTYAVFSIHKGDKL